MGPFGRMLTWSSPREIFTRTENHEKKGPFIESYIDIYKL